MRRNQGAILTLVIVALILVGVVLFVLTGGANAVLFQADTACLRAVQRNLIASGLAWAAERAAREVDTPSSGELVELDATAFGLPSARLAVRILGVQGDTVKVHVETSCHKGRQTLRTSRDYEFPLSRAAPREARTSS